ncbi:MAG: double zinc ribbon domain-containing protein [bacterium]|nr:double zinc ribbon domain-containing protein [bacterium]
MYLIDSVLDIFFPKSCLGCSLEIQKDEVVCRQCFEKIPVNKFLHCGKCGARLPEGEKICHFDFPYILGAAAEYRDKTVGFIVKALKFGFAKDAARPLAELIIACSENMDLAGSDWLVVPVPLGKKRMRKRSFNQAEVIAKMFAEHFSLEMEKSGLVRSRETEPQSEMKNFGARIKNAKGCFSVVSPEKFVGKNIILIDDVSTSGVTFFEAASSLKKSGAKKIIALAAAKG